MRKNSTNQVVAMQFFSVLDCEPLMLDLRQLEWAEEQKNNKTVLTAFTYTYILGLAVEFPHPSMKNSKAGWKKDHLGNT